MRRPILMMPSTHPRTGRPDNRPLVMWTIYRPTTLDHGGWWVARRSTEPPTRRSHRLRRGSFFVARTLEELRAKLPWGLYNIGRNPDDVDVIEEVWL